MDASNDLFDTSSSDSSGNDSSSDEPLILALEWTYSLTARDRIFKKRRCYVDEFSENEFEYRFRMPKYMALALAEQLEPSLKFYSNRNNPIPVVDQLLIALRFYATGNFQIVTGDLFGVSQPTVSRIVRRISVALAKLASTHIKFGCLQKTKEEFYNYAGVPYVIGVIDGTHIPIESPGGENAEQFRNRKGIFSINTQIVCDRNLKILDINARWPGSTHDQMILNLSKLRARFEAGEFGNSIMLGDAGYACSSYLITPLTDPSTTSERAFQRAFLKSRITVERTIGVWKRRFPCIGQKLRLNVDTTVIVIVATAVLHNMLKEREVPPPENNNIIEDPPTVMNNAQSDFSKRNFIISNFF